MSASRVAPRAGSTRAARTRPGAALPRRSRVDVAAPPPGPLELERVAARWQVALDACQRAVAAAAVSLPVQELEDRRRALARERAQTAASLEELARVVGVAPAPWLSPVPVTPRMLGLAATVRACLFDLDGVLTDSGALHARAWGEVFDELLLRLAEKTGWHFFPFDRDADYRAYIDGRPRLEGIHAFLSSRGIRLPEGSPADPADADTARALARRKGEALARTLRARGPAALGGVRRYLEAAGRAGVARGVVSASASTWPMLELAGLARLVEDSVDAEVIHAEVLRSRPAPDIPRVACRRLGVRPDQAVTFTHSEAGVVAAHAAGLLVVGVGDEESGELLRRAGADGVVPSLAALLDPRLREAGSP